VRTNAPQKGLLILIEGGLGVEKTKVFLRYALVGCMAVVTAPVWIVVMLMLISGIIAQKEPEIEIE